MPQVSVCLAVYNGADLLSRALDSVASQEFKDFEIVVVDDGSTDDSTAVAEKYTDRVIRQENGGLGAARRRLVEEARGDLIAFIDHDDEWSPHKLSVQVPAHVSSGAVLSHTGARYVHDDGREWIRSFPHEPGTSSWEQVAFAGCQVIASTAMFNREAMLRAGNFDPSVRLASDWYGWFHLAPLGKFLYIDEPLTTYHVRAGANSEPGVRFFEAERWLIEERLQPKLASLTQGEPPEVVRRAQDGLRLWLAKSHRNLAHFHRLKGDRQKALQHHRESVRLHPTHLGYWLSYLKNGLKPR